MPSASVKTEKEKTDIMDPFKQAITMVEHKIRNLEKRKGKLDTYKSDQAQGKELNGDQLAAVAKYSEVIQQLEFSRDLVKQLTQISAETTKVLKKQQKREQNEKALAEIERLKDLITIQNVINRFKSGKVRRDFLDGASGTLQIYSEDIDFINEMGPMLFPSVSEVDYDQKALYAAEHVVSLLDGKDKQFMSKTYQEWKQLLKKIATCEYITRTESCSSNIEETESSSNLIDSNYVTGSSTEISPRVNPVENETKVQIESPHMDPAVVAVSAYVPSSICSQAENLNSIVNVIPHEVNVIKNLADINLNPPMNSNGKAKEDIEMWDDAIPNAFNPLDSVSSVNLNSKKEDDSWMSSEVFNSNTFNGKNSRSRGKSNRGFRGRGFRGSGKIMSSDRMGVYRSDRSNFDREHEAEHDRFDNKKQGNRKFRGEGPRGRGGRSNPRPYRGGGQTLQA